MTERTTETRIIELCRAGCWASQAYVAELSRAVGRNLIVLITVVRPSIEPSSSLSSRESTERQKVVYAAWKINQRISTMMTSYHIIVSKSTTRFPPPPICIHSAAQQHVVSFAYLMSTYAISSLQLQLHIIPTTSFLAQYLSQSGCPCDTRQCRLSAWRWPLCMWSPPLRFPGYRYGFRHGGQQLQWNLVELYKDRT